jgi:GntR family transcriptional repressor for pyruvate dehydrogenase complex
MPERASGDPIANPAPDSARPPFSSISVTSSWEQVVKQIETAILDGTLKRGQRLPTERNLSATFDVSRGVVREAIKVLITKGLIETRRGSGIYVRNEPSQPVVRAFVLSVAPNAESVEKLIEFRLGLERDAAMLAAERRTEAELGELERALASFDPAVPDKNYARSSAADEAFHTGIAAASGNPYLKLAISAAREMLQDVVRMIAREPGEVEIASRHHQRILDAIRAGDRYRAGAAMEEHIRYTADSVQARAARNGHASGAAS